ncbi:hypothetical protein HQ520_07790 [bacterium]|nr:hypothetical protein [bacterium]
MLSHIRQLPPERLVLACQGFWPGFSQILPTFAGYPVDTVDCERFRMDNSNRPNLPGAPVFYFQ